MAHINIPPKIGYSLLILLGFIFFIGFSYLAYGDYTALSTWRSTNAVVDHSSVLIDRSGKHYMFQANILYNYSFDGKNYSGRCCNSAESNSAAVQSMVDRNSAGKIAEVLVNPSNPSESRLKEDANMTGMLIKVAVALFSLGMMILGIKWIISNPSAMKQ